MPISRILIANRGEIALRIIRACRELGIETVAAYSEADKDAIYLKLVDKKVCIGDSYPHRSYLDIPKIISAAEITNVDAIHPGYGFLAENHHFAEICESCNITFIGPPSKAMRTLGNKIEARRLAKKIGIPVISGSFTPLKDENEAVSLAREIGYPVIIKAAAGGGGRGMRIAHNEVSLVSGFLAAQSEAKSAFGDPSLYLEKLIPEARHVEVQILADSFGNVIHLGERDCSLQRRHQKVIEEAPSPAITQEQREDIGEAAKLLAKEAGYVNAGTVEFLLDPSGNFYFIEMNTRLQVEHPVTEMVTNVDIVKEQIRIASGEPLQYTQDDIELRGTAIELRINAEDPENDFRPSPGTISFCYLPGGNGLRIDSHIYSGCTIPPFYDSLIAKVIGHRPTRLEAIRLLRNALDEIRLDGIKTNIPLLKRILDNSDFIKAKISTRFIEKAVIG